MRGRKPDPSRKKRLRGTAKDKPAGNVEILQKSLKAPENLSDEAKAVWNRTYAELARNHLVTELDLPTLEAYAMAVANLRSAQAEIDRDGITVQSPQGLKKHPALTVLNEATRAINSLGSSLGLNPTARLRLDVQPEDPYKPKRPEDSFDDV